MKRSDVPGEVFSGCASEDSDDEQLKSPPEVIGELLKSPHELLGALDKTLVDPGKQHQSTTPQVIVAIAEGKTEETVEGNTEETVKLKNYGNTWQVGGDSCRAQDREYCNSRGQD